MLSIDKFDVVKDKPISEIETFIQDVINECDNPSLVVAELRAALASEFDFIRDCKDEKLIFASLLSLVYADIGTLSFGPKQGMKILQNKIVKICEKKKISINLVRQLSIHRLKINELYRSAASV